MCLIGYWLEVVGYVVCYKENFGLAVVFGVVMLGEVDIYVDYVGMLWVNEMKWIDNLFCVVMVVGVMVWIKVEWGVIMLGFLGFENVYVLVMKGMVVCVKDIVSIDDLCVVVGLLIFGVDFEFFDWFEWVMICKIYDLYFVC